MHSWTFNFFYIHLVNIYFYCHLIRLLLSSNQLFILICSVVINELFDECSVFKLHLISFNLALNAYEHTLIFLMIFGNVGSLLSIVYVSDEFKLIINYLIRSQIIWRKYSTFLDSLIVLSLLYLILNYFIHRISRIDYVSLDFR